MLIFDIYALSIKPLRQEARTTTMQTRGKGGNRKHSKPHNNSERKKEESTRPRKRKSEEEVGGGQERSPAQPGKMTTQEEKNDRYAQL